MSETSAGAVAAAHAIYEVYKFGGQYSISEVERFVQRLACDPLEQRLAETEAKLEEVTRRLGSYKTQLETTGKDYDELEAKLRECEKNCMSAPVDGVRTWVAKERLDAAEAKLREAEERIGKLRGALYPFIMGRQRLADEYNWKTFVTREEMEYATQLLAAGENSDGEE